MDENGNMGSESSKKLKCCRENTCRKIEVSRQISVNFSAITHRFGEKAAKFGNCEQISKFLNTNLNEILRFESAAKECNV